MKKLFLSVFALSTLAFCSCSNEQKEIIEQDERVEMTFGVDMSESELEDPSTRAIVDDIEHAAPIIAWEDDDLIKIFPKGTAKEKSGDNFNLVNVPNKARPQGGVFTGTTSRSTDKYYLLYPAQTSATFETLNGVDYINAEIPSIQHARLDSFDPNAMVQTGATKDATRQNVNLHNTCAFLYIKVPENVSKVEIKAANNDNWYLAGKVRIETSSAESRIPSPEDNPTFGFIEGKTTITLDNITQKGIYVICVVPTTGCPGLKTTIHYTDGTKKSATKNGSISFDAGVCYNLGIAPDM